MKTLLLLSLLTTLSAQAEVNMKDAGYYKTWIDISGPLQLRRTYNSRSLHNGIFGFGWCSEFETRLETRNPKHVILKDCLRNSDIHFFATSESEYRSLSPSSGALTFRKGFFHYSKGNLDLLFSETGNLLSVQEAPGTKLTLAYSQGRLASVHVPGAPPLKFEWDPVHDKIKTARWASEEIRYRYYKTDLMEATPKSRTPTHYKYDDVHNLTQVLFPDQSSEKITYDKDRDWVVSVQDRHHCLQIFKFNPEGSTAEKRCGGRSLGKIMYRFWHRPNPDGSLALDRFKVTGPLLPGRSGNNNSGGMNEAD